MVKLYVLPLTEVKSRCLFVLIHILKIDLKLWLERFCVFSKCTYSIIIILSIIPVLQHKCTHFCAGFVFRLIGLSFIIYWLDCVRCFYVLFISLLYNLNLIFFKFFFCLKYFIWNNRLSTFKKQIYAKVSYSWYIFNKGTERIKLHACHYFYRIKYEQERTFRTTINPT